MTAAPQPVDKTERAQQTTRQSGAVKSLFGAAVKALTQPADAPEPEKEKHKERERGDTGTAAFRKASKPITQKPAKKITQRRKRPKSYRRAERYLANTLDWLNLWHDNTAGSELGGDHHYTQPTNYLSPRL